MASKHFVIDIETSGPYCPRYGMVQIGAVLHENPEYTFFGTLRLAKTQQFDPEALKYTGLTEDIINAYDDPVETTKSFLKWVKQVSGKDRPIFVSDTTAFDHSFVIWYLWEICGENPFGHAPMSLNALYRGLSGGVERGVHRLRKTRHTHNALDDAKGNQEAMVQIDRMMRDQKMAWLMQQERRKSQGSKA